MSKSVEWYTPKWIFDELGTSFDLDPSSPHDHETFVPAKKKYTVFDDGLKKPWFGRVWLNPPYGKGIDLWMAKIIAHGDGIALVPNSTDSRWGQDAMSSASAILFNKGRINFISNVKNMKNGNNYPSMFLAFGSECADILERLRHRGIYIRNQHQVSKEADLFYCEG